MTIFAELSGGGRMTVTGEGGAKVSATSNTAAMEAAPDFGGGNPPVPVYAPAPAPYGGHGGHGVPPTAPGVVAAVPPAPSPTRGGQGGGKGLIIGLGAVGVLLLAAMAVVAAKSLKSEPDQPLANPFDSAPTTGSTVLAPLIDASDTATPIPTETPTATPDAAATTPTGKPTGKTTTTRPTPSATGTTTGTATGTATTTAPPSSGGAACDACIAAANSGNAVGAKSNFDQCGDAEKKQACLRAVNRGAANAASTAAKLGQCPQAKAIIAAAKAMGATNKKLDTALADTSCK